MIRILLQGRTGNNLFQYAAARALAIRHSTNVVLDAAWAPRSQLAQIRQITRLPLQASYQCSLPAAKLALRKISGVGPEKLHRGPVYKEKSFIYDPIFADLSDHSLLVGFFQNPNYFRGIEHQLRSEIDLSKLKIPENAMRLEDAIRSKPTASLHVRRGDYLNIGTTQCLADNYHQNAIRILQDQQPDIRFCVFSDDINWCRQQFQGNHFIFADFPESASDPFIDLRLMAACNHHIIVNSSYSWWGAWLNPNSKKTVISPARWMSNLPSENVVPSSWMRI